MFRTRTKARDRRPNLENLETRDVPAVFNPLSAWAGILRGGSATVSDAVVTDNTGTVTPNTGSLTPNFPGGTTDPTTPGLPNPGNPLFPGRTTFLRTGPINVGGGVVTTPGGVPTSPGVVGGTLNPPGGSVAPGPQFRFNGNSLRTGPLTPNFPGGTTDPTTPGLPNTGNPLFPGRTTFLRTGPINVGGGNINTGGGVITTPGVNIPGRTFNFNSSFLRTGNPSLGVTTPGVAVPSVDLGATPGDLGLPGVPTPGSL
jgi:hypothetical protein